MASVVAGILPEYFQTFFENVDEHPYLFASLGSMLVGLSGILPMLIIPIDNTASFENGAGAATLRILLSFAVGGMLGDVFLHLLPEAWYHDLANVKEGEPIPMKCGLWCLLGMLMFIIVEKLFAAAEHGEEEEAPEKKHNGSVKQLEIEEIDKLLEKERQHRLKLGGKVEGNGALPGCNGDATAKQIYESCLFNNNVLGDGACCNEIASQSGAASCNKGGRWMGRCLLREAKEKALQANNDKKDNTGSNTKHIAGYLNLMANSIDNFTHGLAVGGSFLVGARVGALTTFAILVHEIPHEVGDFAILLKSGFTRWEAAKAQLATASAGLIGAMTAVIFSGAKNSIEARTSWVAPFTAGGFLHIALVTVLPELLRQPGRRVAATHLAALLAGLALMALLNLHF